MKAPALILVTTVMIGTGCTDEPSPSATRRRPDQVDTAAPAASTTPAESTASEDVLSPRATREIAIYSAAIRQVVKDHTYGNRPFPFKVIYVVNGPVKEAGSPRHEFFGPAPRPFASEVIGGIRDALNDGVPPLRFVRDANEVRRGRDQLGGVKNGGVILALGTIEKRKDRVRVANTFWCGGKCGRWLTYVLSEQNNRWIVTGTDGPTAVS